MQRVLLSLLSLSFLLAGCKSDQDLAQETLARARTTSDPVAAIALLETATGLDPNAHSAWALLAENQLAASQHDAAKTSIERALTIADLGGYRAILGDIELARTEYANAVAAFDQALAAGSPAPELNPWLAQALIGLGEATLSEASSLEGSEAAPTRITKQKAAIGQLARALSLDPSQSQVHFVLAETHRTLSAGEDGRDHEASANESYRAAIEANVEPFQSRMGIAEMLLHPAGGESNAELSADQLAKVEAILTEAGPLAEEGEERARHANAQAELDRLRNPPEQQVASAALPAGGAAGGRTGLRRQAVARAQNVLLAALGGSGGVQLADVLAGGAVTANVDDVLAQAGGVGVAPRTRGGAAQGGGGQLQGLATRGHVAGTGYANSAMPAGPRAILRMTSPNVQGGMNAALVQRQLRRRSLALRRCYEMALARNPSLGGRVTLLFTIEAGGRVASSDVKEGLSDAAVGTCAARQVRRMRFPSATDRSIVTVGLNFSTSSP